MGVWSTASTGVYLLLILLASDGINYSEGMNKMPPPEAKLYPGFNRQCPVGNDECKFASAEADGTAALYFKCRENNICFCSRGTAPADVLVWPVNWDGERCIVGKGGPCGEDRGLAVHCFEDLLCIQGRCRNSTEINSGELNQFCHEDIDCQQGLSCKAPAQNMEIRIKRCLTF